jgi:hypothetical protein
MLSVNLACARINAGVGALAGAVIPLLLTGFLTGFFPRIYVVTRQFHDL